MRYAKIDEYEISNGALNGMSLYVQGCRFRCPNCFNPETWDFNGGKEWTKEVKEKFLELIDRAYIKRVSILGGEPLADENLDGVLDLVNEIRLLCPQKTIWVYTGYTFAEIMKPIIRCNESRVRKIILSSIDVLVDGRYIDSQQDITLPYRGSKNQRIIDIQKSLQKREVIYYKIRK